MRQQISAPPAVDSELAELQSSQKGLLGRVEEVQTLDAGGGADTWLTQTLQVTLARTGVVQAGQECQVAVIATQQNVAQINHAVNRLLQRSQD